MRRRTLVVLALIGLAFVVASDVLIVITTRTGDFASGASAVLLSLPASVLAAIVLLGGAPTRWWFRATIPTLAVLAAIGAWISLADLIFVPMTANEVCSLGGAAAEACGSLQFDPRVVIIPTVAFVLYLIAATLYGFAGQAQGVKVGARTGLLVLLLLSVIPLANILGLVGFLIVAIRRKPA